MTEMHMNMVSLAPTFAAPAAQLPYQPGTARQTIGNVLGALVGPISPALGGIVRNAVGGTGGLNIVDPALVAMQAQMAASSRSLLMLQYWVNMESQMVQAASAAMKARHDSAMFAIQNIR